MENNSTIDIKAPQSKIINNIETNIFEIAEIIFNQPPKPPQSIQLIMDHDLPENTDIDQFEYQLISQIALYGAQKLFQLKSSELESLEFKSLDLKSLSKIN